MSIIATFQTLWMSFVIGAASPTVTVTVAPSCEAAPEATATAGSCAICSACYTIQCYQSCMKWCGDW
jgi:hypothetical protein